MHLRLVVISAACLSIAVPATCTSLLVGTAGTNGLLLGTGLTATQTTGGSGTAVVQAGLGSVADLAANQVLVHDPVIQYQPAHKPQTVMYTIQSSSPLSRLWDVIAAKTKAIGNLFSPPNRVVIVNSAKEEPTVTITKPTTIINPPKPIIEFEAGASLNPHLQRLYPVSVVNYVKK